MSAIFLLPVCLTYYSTKYTTCVDPNVDNSHQVGSWYDHPLPSYSVFVCWYVTWPGDIDLLTLRTCHTWRVTWPTLPPSMKTPRLSILELWVITVPIDYHWKCVRGHCECAESHDPWVGGEKRLNFCNPRPRCAYSLYNFGGSTMNIIKVICENNERPVLKNVSDSAHARNHVICLRWPKCLVAVVLVHVDLPYRTSKVEHIVSFTAIFSNICTRMRRNGYLWTSCVNLDTAVQFADPDFLVECKISAIWWRFPLIFAFYILNVRHISTSGLFDQMT